MAGGMAMSGRRLPALARLREIRDQFQRKFARKVSVAASINNQSIPLKETQDTQPQNVNLLMASKLLEELYAKEVNKENVDEASMKYKVSEIFEQLYQKQHISKRSERQCTTEAGEIVEKVSSVALSFIELWIQYHHLDFNHEDLRLRLCNAVDTARQMGKVSALVAETIKDHFLFLQNESSLSCL